MYNGTLEARIQDDFSCNTTTAVVDLRQGRTQIKNNMYVIFKKAI